MRDPLKISVKIGESSYAQYFRVADDTRSGPVAFLLFCLHRTPYFMLPDYGGVVDSDILTRLRICFSIKPAKEVSI